MPVACPVASMGPPVNGVYRYYARYCPGVQTTQILSEVELSLNGCQPNGTPGPGCQSVPPPLTRIGPGEIVPTAVSGAVRLFHVMPDLGDQGLTAKMAWLDPVPATAAGVSILNQINAWFYDSLNSKWRAARFFLFFVNFTFPDGRQLPPHFFGTGWELAEDTIPAADKDRMLTISQSDSQSVAAQAHEVELAGIRYLVVTKD